MEYLSEYQHDFPQDSFLYPQPSCSSYGNMTSLPDIFSQHNQYGWSSPFDENIYLHHALTSTKCSEYLEEYPEYTTSDLGVQGIEDSLITPKEEFEYDKEIPEVVGTINPDYISPSLFYYPLSPAQIFSQIEPHSNLPLFTLPPISQLISNEN
ncbi:hypothetical protein LOD99_641 [Oopsacas minuta]|uniref:Uncharacterized protein n=1 Tax=Oopsacas minuta TaxID=111878 RepID=A0AAV7JZ61_9METZ|nr:hypothetical protein LOD99_641 [Oopsacas minuta]